MAAANGGIELAELPAPSAAGCGLHDSGSASSGGNAPGVVVDAAQFVSSEAHMLMANGAASNGATGSIADMHASVLGGAAAHAPSRPQPVHHLPQASQVFLFSRILRILALNLQ